jgi:tetratricopeptide (TPR) repeat protein
MPAAITAVQRRELARMFERAKQFALAQPPDFAGTHRVLAECCTIDPGNTLFVQALLENLQRARGKTTKAWPWQVWSLASALDSAVREQRFRDALAKGWRLLGERPQDPTVLRKLADVCDALDHQQTQLLLLQSAYQVTPQDSAVLQALQKALAGAGQFEAAAKLSAEVPKQPALLEESQKDDLVSAVELAVEQGQWGQAEKLFAEQGGAAGANIRLRELGEEIMLGRAREKTRLAEEQAAREPTPRHQQLVAEVQGEQRRIELGVAFARYERFPSEPASSWELAQCLTRVGNFSEALKYLAPLNDQPAWRIRALIASGENWQHLRQFDRALDSYRQAISIAEQTSVDEQLIKAWYRGAVLAEAMGRIEQAVDWLERLTAADPGYKDAAARLVKLRAVCDKGGFSAEPAAGQST